MSLEHLVVLESNEVLKKMLGPCQNDTEAIWKESPMGKAGII